MEQWQERGRKNVSADGGFERTDRRVAAGESAAAPAPSQASLEAAFAELREKEAMLVAAQRLARLGSWSLDVGTGALKWSDEAHRIFGLEHRELQTLSLPQFVERVHPHDRGQLQQLIHDACAGPVSSSFAYRFLSVNGEVRRIRGDGESQLDEHGRVVRLVGTVMDVTDQERLERNAARVDVLEQGSVWVWEQDEQFRFTMISRGEAYGPRWQALGHTRWDSGFVPLSASWEEHRRVLDARQPFRDFEYRDGDAPDARVVSTTGVPFFRGDGSFAGYRGTAIDITPFATARAKAGQAQALLEIAARLGRVGAWVLELPSMELAWSSEFSQIHESPRGVQPTWDEIVSSVHAPWRGNLEAAVRTCARTGVPFDLDARASTAKGNTVWLRIVGEALRDASGEVRRIQGAAQDITETRGGTERLQRLNDELTSTLESITDAFMVMDRELRLTYVNPEAEALLRRPRRELLDHMLDEFLPFFRGSVFEREMRASLEQRTTSRFDGYSPTLGKWLQMAIYPSPGGITVYSRDITAARRDRQALATSEERYRLLFEESGEAILESQVESGIRRANPAACALFGRTEDELRRMKCADLVIPGDTRLDEMTDERVRVGRTRGQLTLVRADGSTFEAEVSARTYRTSDGEALTALLIRDVSQRVADERRIVAAKDELALRVKQRTAELEAANEELRGLAHAMAHDLRSPIAAILGFGGTLHDSLERTGTERERHYSQRVLAAARRMDEHMEALLSLASISQASLFPTTVNLSTMAAAVFEELHQRDPSRAVATHVEYGVAAHGDPRLLRIVLENLIGNAWKFSAGGAHTQIAFHTRAAEDGATVYCVEDNGAGFDMAWADKLFGNFQRLHSEAEFPGTGLGLANVRRIVTRHGGRVWAESAPGRGARFMFTLPGASALAGQVHPGARRLVRDGTAMPELALGLHRFGEPQVGADPQRLDL
jgi:PAS domain S-box-containing protein